MPRTRRALTSTLLVLGIAAIAPISFAQNDTTQPHAGMLRYPAISATELAFVYAGKLWRAPRTGGVAVPAALPPGGVTFPRFSPDGKTLAFTANYDGNADLYTIPTAGGIPERLTHHPGPDLLCGWTPDGRLLYTNRLMTPTPRISAMLTVSASGGQPTPLPIPYGEDGALSPDGRFLAYTPSSTNDRTWKRYRGGWAQDIWVFDLQTKTARKVTDWEGTDTLPMWADTKTLFYLSDNGPEHRLNLWKLDLPTGKRRQVTRYADYDVKWPSIGGGGIVFQHGAQLVVLDTTTEKAQPVRITIPGDRPALRPRTVDAARQIASLSLAPSAKRVALGARGDIWAAPAKDGTPRNLTRTSGAHERDPAWSPDGKWIAYLCDASGEYELYLLAADGKGAPRRLTHGGTAYRQMGQWSPDAKWLTFSDKTGALFLLDVEKATVIPVDVSPTGDLAATWSPDARWLAYAKADDPREAPVIWIYSLETKEKRAVTGGMFADTNPVFDRKGEWLYYTSNRSFRQPTYDENMSTWIYTNTQVLVAVPLRADIASPLLPKSDEEPGTAPAKPAEPKKTEVTLFGKPVVAAADEVSGTWAGTLSGTPTGDVSITITLTLAADGRAVSGTVAVAGRGDGKLSGTYDPAAHTLDLNVAAADTPPFSFKGRIVGNTLILTGGPAGFNLSATLNRQGAPAVSPATPPAVAETAIKIVPVRIDFDAFEARGLQLPVPPGTFGSLGVNAQNQLLYVRTGKGIQLFDMTETNPTEKTVNAGAAAFELSADGKNLLVPAGAGASIQVASAGSTPTPIVTRGMNATIEPRAEWAQLLREAWRIERDFFYDPNMHGVDWPAVLKQYEAMLPDAVNRADVGVLIAEMIAELNVGHAYYSAGPDDEPAPSVGVGMLGCDFTRENGAYRIGKIYRGAPWDTDARSPLSQPGALVKTGDYLLAVNGAPIDPKQDVWAAFVGLDNRTVTMTVSAKPTLDGDAREVPIRLLGSETGLRFRDWIETNRKKVETLSGGKIGYIYVPDTGTNGQAELVRQFVGQLGKPALLIDDRWNGGGQIPTRFIELLNRPATNYWARRDGKDWVWPPDGHNGPKAMLINGLAGSGGDAFPFYFRQAGLGKLIGTRTWGGLVGISGNPGLLDGASVTAPTFAFYKTDGHWGIEGHGVDPDIEVIDDPAKMQNGADPQLEAAVAHLLDALKKKPYIAPRRPTYPDRKGMGIKKEDI
jgi:tricorn protease